MAPCNGTTSTRKVGRHPPPNHSTLQWHPAMAPSNGTTSTPPKLPPNHSTLQWHPAMAPRPLPQSWLSPSPQPYHTTMAPYDGTQQWHHVPQSWSSTPPLHPHYNGNVQWHPAMAPRPLHPAMAPWCHVQSAKVVRRFPPLLEVRTPIAIAIWGKTGCGRWWKLLDATMSLCVAGPSASQVISIEMNVECNYILIFSTSWPTE